MCADIHDHGNGNRPIENYQLCCRIMLLFEKKVYCPRPCLTNEIIHGDPSQRSVLIRFFYFLIKDALNRDKTKKKK